MRFSPAAPSLSPSGTSRGPSTTSATTQVTLSTPPAASAASTSGGGLVRVVKGQADGDLAVVHQVGEAVGADQHPVPETYVDRPHVRRREVFTVDGLEHDVLLGVPAGVLAAEHPGVDERLHVGVVVGELGQLAVAEQVGARVPHVPQDHPLPVGEQDRQRRTHAEAGRLGRRTGAELLVGQPHRLLEQPGQVGTRSRGHPVGQRAGDVGRGRGRHLAGGGTTDPVRDQLEVGPA